MSDVLKATIQIRKVSKGTQAFIVVPSKKGSRDQVLGAGMLSRDVADLLANQLVKLEGIEVEYEMVGGQPKRVRRAGTAWEELGDPKPKGNGPQQKPDDRRPKFENPYNFVPAPPREQNGTGLDDDAPRGHHRYHEKHWSGRIGVRLTTKTPLLIPDAAKLEKDGVHPVFPIRTSSDGSPYLPPTSIKGMLRNAYEAVTNSRMGVFAGHDDPLALRYAARSGAAVVPARVSDCEQFIYLLPGFTHIQNDGKPSGNPAAMYAAWLPAYEREARLLRSGQNCARHLFEVWAELELWAHYVFRYGQWRNNFNLWRVVTLKDGKQSRPVEFCHSNRERAFPHTPHNNRTHSTPVHGTSHCWVKGFVFRSNKNIGRKHDERVFFVGAGHPQQHSLRTEITNQHREQWRVLISNYQDEHQRERDQNITRPPALPTSCVWSRHIEGGEREQKLQAGTLCYAKVKANSRGGFDVEALYPVMISRDLYNHAPDCLLPESLRPASAINQLSPADRVFGWVNATGNDQQESGNSPQAFKGKLRVGQVTCDQGASAIEQLDIMDAQGLALAILGQPKPQQERFYVAQDKTGKPLPSPSEKGSGFAHANQGLRGRKVYPHQRQAEPESYWSVQSDPGQPLGEHFNGMRIYPEFHRLPDPGNDNRIRDNQNRSVRAWVKPGMTFGFGIQVTNISAVELGALLWLLSLDEGHYLRLGLGKPLGFGSVRLAIESLDLRDGRALAEDYQSLLGRGQGGDRLSEVGSESFMELVKTYQKAVLKADKASAFDQVLFIKAFLNACRGGKIPVHYPRKSQHPTSESKVYEWFVENEKGGKGPRLSLPSLTENERGLPYFD